MKSTWRWLLVASCLANVLAAGEPEPRVVPDVGLELVWIPALGAWVGRYEVSNAQYRQFRPGHHSGEFAGQSLDGDAQPVAMVSWQDAQAFADWLTQRERQAERLEQGWSFRLPAPREWAFLAKCGTDREYPWEGAWPPTTGNFCDRAALEKLGYAALPFYRDGYPVSAPVTATPTNEWGLHGMADNVAELTTLPVVLTYRDPQGHTCAMGGFWGAGGAWQLRAEFPIFLPCPRQAAGIGFRVILSKESVQESTARLPALGWEQRGYSNAPRPAELEEEIGLPSNQPQTAPDGADAWPAGPFWIVSFATSGWRQDTGYSDFDLPTMMLVPNRTLDLLSAVGAIYRWEYVGDGTRLVLTQMNQGYARQEIFQCTGPMTWRSECSWNGRVAPERVGHLSPEVWQPPPPR